LISETSAKSAFPFVGKYEDPNAYDQIWNAGQRKVPSTETEFVWKPYPGGKVQAMKYNAFRPGQPDFFRAEESCAEFVYKKQKALWNDGNCNRENHFVCEIDI